ncbi:MAG: hypothetical protein C0599_14830 [Salinivirgaceae bacterium]|nr:MAG: hypothetical protein C0599_14830 [Salinivirgaceae bacterium]
MRKIIVLLLTLLIVISCSDEFSLAENDIDLTKDWEETVGVFSNLNLHDRKHYIRISRGFAGNNFFLSNTNPDSIYFDPSQIEVNLYKIRVHQIVDGIITEADTLGVYPCRDTILPKDTLGMFYTDEVPLWYAETKAFSVTNADDLYVGLQIITPNREISSFTNMIPETEFVYPNQFLPRFPIENNTFDARIRLPRLSQIYRVEGNCSYFEITKINGITDTTLKTFNFLVGSRRINDPVEDYGETYLWRVSTDIFYSGIERDVLQNGDTVNTIARILDGISFSGYAGNADLALISTGLSVISGFSDEPIHFSNIRNGLGYFSAFAQFNTKKFPYSYETIDSVVNAYGGKYYFRRDYE